MAIFLDSNAHVAMNKSALRALDDFHSSLAGHGNPMALSLPGREASSAIENARSKIAALIGAESHNQIIFTSTCTQACEWALNFIKAKNPKNIFYSPLEHSAIRHTVGVMFPNGVELSTSKDGNTGCVFPPPPNSFFICIHAQNEIGTLQNIEAIQAPLFSDMSQSLARIPINVSRIPNLQLAAFGAHKFGGPSGVGFLYMKDTSWWKAVEPSTNRYYTDRPGTPDTGSIVATAAALEEAMRTLPERYERMVRFRDVLEREIESLGLKIIGKSAARIPSTTSVHIGERMGPYLMSQLETEGIFIGLGTACAALGSVMGPNPLMTRLGYGGHAHDFIRISHFGDYAEKEAHIVAKALKKYCPRVSDLP
jgi:cysteine desulfurase